jgi:hypothetical protein
MNRANNEVTGFMWVCGLPTRQILPADTIRRVIFAGLAVVYDGSARVPAWPEACVGQSAGRISSGAGE